MLYTVYKKTPGIDIDMLDPFEGGIDIDLFDDELDAVAFAAELQRDFADPEWEGHPHYRGRFYAAPITVSEIRSKAICFGYATQPV